MATTYHNQTLRDAITRDVIECARDAGDRTVIEAGYRCLAAWRLGRKADAGDWSLIRHFAGMEG